MQERTHAMGPREATPPSAVGAGGGEDDRREAEAMRVALSGSARDKARVAVRALRGLLADPNQTEQVFVLGAVLNAPILPFLLTRFAMDPEGSRLLEERPTIDRAVVDRLRALPAHTLGGAYVRFLEENELAPDIFRRPPGLPPLPAYVAQRIRQTHDLWHVLTGYPTDVPGEVALQAYTFGQLRAPSAGLIALAGSLRWSPRDPSLVAEVVRAFRAGARTPSFLAAVAWEDRWERPLDEVRRELGIEPVVGSLR